MAASLEIAPEEVLAFTGAGCPDCNTRGYRGRVAIYEFFTISDNIADLIVPAVKTGQLRRAARLEGWRSLREMGWMKVQNGMIALSEQRRLNHRLVPHVAGS